MQKRDIVVRRRGSSRRIGVISLSQTYISWDMSWRRRKFIVHSNHTTYSLPDPPPRQVSPFMDYTHFSESYCDKMGGSFSKTGPKFWRVIDNPSGMNWIISDKEGFPCATVADTQTRQLWLTFLKHLSNDALCMIRLFEDERSFIWATNNSFVVAQTPKFGRSLK